MALSVLVSPMISLVVRKAGNSLIEQFCKMHGMEKNRKKLQRQLLAVQAVICNAEDRGANEPLVQAWLTELNVVAYEAADVLDEFQYEALRRLALSQDPSSSIEKVIKSITLHEKSILFRCKMSTKLMKILEKINEIISEMKTFNFIEHYPQPVVSRLPTHSYVTKSEVIGRDNEKEEIVNMLLDPIMEMKNVSVLPIVGMGGAGKTTLAQLVYNEKKVKDHFELQLWVCACNDLDVVNIVKSIIEVASNEQFVSASNMEVLQKRLRDVIEGKKYLLVLDDVWNEDIQKWDALKTLLFSSACSGSVIIVTTRNKNVASMMGTLPYHDLSVLSKEDSWNLFRVGAFGEAEEQQQFVKIGRMICGMCAGLPLALKAIGGLMRTMQDLSKWRIILENKIWDGESSNTGILPALKLSYNQLPDYMKQCFAFCAIFPYDYVIEKDTLIHLWIANDFIPTDETMDLEDRGEYIFYELCQRSFFQEIKKDIYGESVTCKIHDLMLDLANHVVGMHCDRTHYITSDQVLQFLVMHNHSSGNQNSVPKVLRKICTYFTSKEFVNESDNKENYDSVKPISPRALTLQGTDQLPMELGYMKHLRYLDLSRGNFDSLPETVSTWHNLQTLNLSYSKVSKLPEDMRYMISMRHLFLNGCFNLERVPTGLGQLRCLRTLTHYIVDYGPGCSIGQLNNLNLHGNLILSGLEKIRDKNEANAANMFSKTNLCSLELKWGSMDSEDTTRNDQQVLDGLRSPSEIKDLVIRGYTGSYFPIWMKEASALKNLRRLCFDSCCNCTSLPPIWQLPLLENLYLDDMPGLVYICSRLRIEDEERERLIMFPKLKILVITYLDNLKGCHEKNDNLVCFPQLEKLFIDDCPKIRTIPCAVPSLRKVRLKNAKKIKLLDISNLSMVASSELSICYDTFCADAKSSKGPDAFRPPNNIVKMKVEGFKNVIPLEDNNKGSYQPMTLLDLDISDSDCFFSDGPWEQPLGFWKYFASLEILYIHSCDVLSFWPEQEFKSLKCLRKLQIGFCYNFTCLSKESPSSVKLSREYTLPRLEYVRFRRCPKLVTIPQCYKSLKTLYLDECPSLSEERLRSLTNFHELEQLFLEYSEGIKSLPDGLESLTSLEYLSLYKCPGIESFPQGLQQRLPALQYLRIGGCSVLKRRCESGGDYHHLVSAIPDLRIE